MRNKQNILYGFIAVVFAFLTILVWREIYKEVTTEDALQVEYEETTTILETTTAKVEETTEEITITELICLGEFEVTAYCACERCCGKSDGITATGTKATAGRTLAVDPNEIPYGSVVVIGGNEYIAEDCGGSVKGNVVDIYFDSHDEAAKYGRQIHTVYVRG
jgi:3D (Asp-Asp-Asp) domain-containing protein